MVAENVPGRGFPMKSLTEDYDLLAVTALILALAIPGPNLVWRALARDRLVPIRQLVVQYDRPVFLTAHE
jgi:hypothetical protein